jgi:signal transduction histidine kinase
MSLRRKIIFKDVVLLGSLLLMIAAALWGLQQQREHVQASLNEYSALQKVEVAEGNLFAFQQAVQAGQMKDPKAIADLRGALSAMSEYKAVISQYQNTLPPEITPDLQTAAKTRTKSLVSALVQLTMQLDPSVHRGAAHPEGAAPPVASDVTASVNRISRDLGDLLVTCNGFVHRTQLESDHDVRLATLSVAGFAGAILLLAISASLWQYRKTVIPLRRLQQWCRRTASGDFSVPYTPANDREFKELGRDVNKMAEELNAFYRRLEEMVASKSRELVRSERLASVGYLAAGVAHEINNPLNIMSGYAELSLKRLRREGIDTADSETAKHLAIIRSEAFRCKEITQKLLSLAKGNGDVHEIISLSDTVAEVATMVRGLKSFRGKQLLADLDPDEPLFTRANLTEMKQVLLNLIINAIEAVAEGNGKVVVQGRRTADSVEVEVSDNGRGMTSETVDRVFEPFFTNKRGVGDPGTGLGLSITHAIITHHGGEIRVFSDGPNHGSRFIVRLPAAPARSITRERKPASEVLA